MINLAVSNFASKSCSCDCNTILTVEERFDMGAALKTNDFMEIMKGRLSIRSYDPTIKISKEEMTLILEEATTAPSAVNAQTW